jgi:hypothetical protein
MNAKADFAASAPESTPTFGHSLFSRQTASAPARAINTPLKSSHRIFNPACQSRFSGMVGLPAKPAARQTTI